MGGGGKRRKEEFFDFVLLFGPKDAQIASSSLPRSAEPPQQPEQRTTTRIRITLSLVWFLITLFFFLSSSLSHFLSLSSLHSQSIFTAA